MADPIDAVVARFEQKAHEWEADVKRMRALTAVNPPADTLAFAATELLGLVREVRTTVEELSPEAYARLHSCSPQTVRRWCAAGRLGARREPGGDWRIPRTATPPKRRKRAA